MNELYILCVIDNMKIEWQIIDYNIINTTLLLDRYLKRIYNEKIEIDYNKQDIKQYKLENIIETNPNRLCIKIYLDI
tara:strand:+ start:400 stop:630 length:231 start_codon:yes stop_codon:yes gene_type:complete